MHHRNIIASAIVLTSALVAPANAQAPKPPQVVHGVATTEDGKPLARATLYMRALPPTTGGQTVTPDETVMTDDQGRFTWRASDQSGQLNLQSIDNTICYALASDARDWTVTRITHQVLTGRDYELHTMLEQATRQCVTHLNGTGAQQSLSVVVPTPGTVTLTLSGADGERVTNRPVSVSMAKWAGVQGALVYNGRTDGQGQIRMRCFPGETRLQVLVPGVGVGWTGSLLVLPGRDVERSLPRLAPFARVSGRVEAPLAAPGEVVHAESWRWYQPETTVRPDGSFTLTGLLPGPSTIVAAAPDGKQASAAISLTPGENKTGVTLIRQISPIVYSQQPPSIHSVVTGHVFDADGKPAAGVDVHAFVSTPQYARVRGRAGWLPMLATKTDSHGAYQIESEGDQGWISVTMVAKRPGFPAAIAPARGFSDSSPGNLIMIGMEPAAKPRFERDLVLPNSHTELTIHVLRHGAPAAGVGVTLSLPGRFDNFDTTWIAEPKDAAGSVLTPAAETDANGDIRFTDIAPGAWTVYAATAPPNGARLTQLDYQWNRETALLEGVGVAAGAPRRFSLTLHDPLPSESFQITAADGQPIPEKEILLGLALPPLSNPAGLERIKTDRNGIGAFQPWTQGLVLYSARYSDLPGQNSADLIGPSYSGSADWIAQSPDLPKKAPATIRMARHELGSIRVRLEDAQGRRASGTAALNIDYGSELYAASLDASGEAAFLDMPTGSHRVTAFLPGQPAPPFVGDAGQPFPDNDTLTGVTEIRPTMVSAATDHKTLVIFRPTPVGYIRGRIAAPGHTSGYAVTAPEVLDSTAKLHYERKTGEFLLGPLPIGPTRLRLYRVAPSSGWAGPKTAQYTVTVSAGRVANAVLTPDPTEPDISPQTMDAQAPLDARVLLSDGVTPAWGARVALMAPNSWRPLKVTRTDALGIASIIDYNEIPSFFPTEPVGAEIDRPMLVAWLPGSNGASIVPYTPGKTAAITLPAPAAIHGRITVGDKPIDGLTSSFTVTAAYQGQATLASLFQVKTTAQSDGSFDLAGLTPGVYLIQAARDGIWLSESKTVTVGKEPLPDLAFDIGAPGAAIVLHITDAEGKPLADQSVTVARPAGPLTNAYWPKTFTTDTDGNLRLEGLEAGQHQISAGDGKGQARLSKPFAVPPFVTGEPAHEATVVVHGG